MGYKTWLKSEKFEKDPKLTEEDKIYYRGRLKEVIEADDELEIIKIKEKIKEKDADWLGRWLQRFSIEGDFWGKEKREKNKKENWL